MIEEDDVLEMRSNKEKGKGKMKVNLRLTAVSGPRGPAVKIRAGWRILVDSAVVSIGRHVRANY